MLGPNCRNLMMMILQRTVLMVMWTGAQNVIVRELKAKRKLYIKRKQNNDRVTVREGVHTVAAPHSG